MSAHPSSGDSERAVNFVDNAARMRFWLLCACTFLIFLSNSATALFAKVFASSGHEESAVGTVLAIYGISTIVGILISGFAAKRFGVLQTIKTGSILLLFSYLSYALTLDYFYGVIVSRLVQGFAYGLFLAPSMLFAKAQLSKRYLVTLFGVFSGMIPLPNAIGPPIAAWLLEHFGNGVFFFVTAPPMLLGVIGLLLMGSNLRPNARTSSHQYSQLIRRADVRWVCATIGFVGLVFGVVPSYMASYLIDNEVSVAAFFSTFTVVMFCARFFVAPLIERASHNIVVGAGILSMGFAYVATGYSPRTQFVLPAGILFGLGYSLCYPRLSVMAIMPFADNDREKPIALFNLFFIAGTYLTPYVIGTFKHIVPVSMFLIIMGASAIIFGVGFLAKAAFAYAPSQNLHS